MCNTLTYPFPNVNAAKGEVWESISKFITHFDNINKKPLNDKTIRQFDDIILMGTD